MNEIKIDGLAKFKGINFSLVSPLDLKPTEKFPEAELAKGKIDFASVNASTGEFAIGESGDVKFSAGGEGFAAFGVYRKTDVLLKDLKEKGLSEQLASLLNLQIAKNENLLAMRLGYNFKASAEGKVALFSTPVNLSFGASGKTHGLSVLLHSVKSDKTVAESVRETLESWTTPRQVKTLDDLKEKTTVIFETMGRLEVGLKVAYGYEFSWVRDALKLGGLSGDLGLKIEMGVAATFGYNTVGHYALALSRETTDAIRLQVYKMKESGMSFAFDGGFSSQFSGSLPPKSLDEFIKGVFNLNGSQVLKDFEKWTNEENSLEELIGEEIMGAADDFLRRVAGHGLSESIDILKRRLKEVIEKWHALPHEFSSYLYGLLGKSDELGKLKEFLKKAQSVSQSPDKIIEEIENQIKDREFYNSPVVKFLTAFAGEGILSLLPDFNDEKLAKFNELVDKTLGLLDGDKLESTLKKLQEEIDERLHLDKIVNAEPDKWLRKRLDDFLGDSKIVDELEKIRKAINELRRNGEKFYQKGYEALMRKYSFSINYAYQKTTANSALIDLTFNFDEDSKAGDYLKLALEGDFKSVLTDDSLGFVRVNKAVLTHDINRSSHLGVSVPSFDAMIKHITKSSAKAELVETNGDRLWIYNLEAEDVLEKRKSLSRLAIAAQFSENTGVRTFSPENNRLDYSMAYGKMKVDSRFIERRFEIGVDTYMRSEFPAKPDYFRTYLFELDKQLDSKGFDKPNEFGNVLASIKVNVPGGIMAFWDKIPEAETDEFYKKLSGVVQHSFRAWIPRNYIEDSKMYEDDDLIKKRIYPLLVYQCLPTLTELQGKGEFKKAFYWDYESEKRRKEIFDDPDLRIRLGAVLENVRRQTNAAGYHETDIPAIIKETLSGKGEGSLEMVCKFERKVLEEIVETIDLYLEFKKEAKPEKKIEKLAKFGEEFVETFNDRIGHIKLIPDGSLRPLGLLLFARIARILMPEFTEGKMAALFELMVLRDGIDDDEFDKIRDRYKQGNYPTVDDKQEDIVFQQRIVNTGSLPL